MSRILRDFFPQHVFICTVLTPHITIPQNNVFTLTITINKSLLFYNLLFSPLASQLMSGFCPIPALYVKIPTFYADIFLFRLQCASNVCGWVTIGCLRSVANDSESVMHGQGGRVGARLWWKELCECAREIIMVHNVLRQTKAWYWVPVRPPVPRGNVKEISKVNCGLWPWYISLFDVSGRERNCIFSRIFCVKSPFKKISGGVLKLV